MAAPRVQFGGDVQETPAPRKKHDAWSILPPRYEVKTEIGKGAYGCVAEAYDKKDERLVAIKKMPELFEDLVDCKRILREVCILAKLNHPNVVRLFDLPVPPNPASFDQLCIVMEIADTDMKKLVRTDVTLAAIQINTLLYHLLRGLKYIHSAGIYHRDLKPANCLVDQDCSVKICDFGLARAVALPEQKHLPAHPETPPGSDGEEEKKETARPALARNLTKHVVTRWYRAPELILLQENYTEAIDMWSVGCIYAELLGMLEGCDMSDRGPLFPGASCFPLSPDRKHKTDYKYHTRGKQEQLNVIFSLIGTPTEAEVDEMLHRDTKTYVKCFTDRQGDGMKARFPWVDEEAQDILIKMLKFSTKSRITVTDAIEHPIFIEIREPETETITSGIIELNFEKEELDEDALRKHFLEEIEKFHPGLLPDTL